MIYLSDIIAILGIILVTGILYMFAAYLCEELRIKKDQRRFKAFWAGHDAGREGLGSAQNPYDPKDMEHKHWHGGMMHAHMFFRIEARREGRNAYQQGEPLEGNPYALDNHFHTEWEHGYMRERDGPPA